MRALVFDAMREGYSIDQIRNPMTVGELMEILEEFDPDTLFILSHDRGYTYGSVSGFTVMHDSEGEYGVEWTEEEC